MNQFDLFVSYSHSDSPLVGRVIRRLHEYGIDCFLDNWALRGGDLLNSALQNAILSSRGALVFVSAHSLASVWCQSEVNWLGARSQTDGAFRIIPVRLDDSPLPDQLTHRVAHTMLDHSDPHVIDASDWIARTIDKLNPGILGRTGVLTDRVIARVQHVVEALALNVSHPKLSEIAYLMSRSGCSVRDAGPCSCGGAVLCGFVDLGFVDWYSNFFHICPDCLRHDHKEAYIGATQETGAERMCPWCEPIWMW